MPKPIAIRIDLVNMLDNKIAMLSDVPTDKADFRGTIAELTTLRDHVKGVRDGEHTMGQFCDFYMMKPAPKLESKAKAK